MAMVTRRRWDQDTILGASYAISVHKKEERPEGRTMIQLGNPSATDAVALCESARLRRRSAGELYDGKARWLIYPQQFSGWFEIEKVLGQKGKSIEQMTREATDDNWKTQLTMTLMIEFEDQERRSASYRLAPTTSIFAAGTGFPRSRHRKRPPEPQASRRPLRIPKRAALRQGGPALAAKFRLPWASGTSTLYKFRSFQGPSRK